MKKKYLIIALIIFNLQGMFAQLMIKEVSLKTLIESSNLVVEGKVTSKKSFWDAEGRHIYTANTVQIYKVFKGEPQEIIEVVTPGGTVGLIAEIVNPSLKLNIGDSGIFTLYDNNITMKSTDKSALNKFKPYGSSQGFYKYNLYDNVAVNTFSKKQGIASSFYEEIMSYTKSNYTELMPFDAQSLYLKSTENENVLKPSSITFSPTTSSAGTKSVLTIQGSSFGTTEGTVSFRNADDGGATFVDALETQVLTWSDTQITVEIPSNAGTGTIMVTDAASSSTVSTSSLTISYSEINAHYDADDETSSGGINGTLPMYAYRVQHIEDNDSGGYTLQLFTDFENNINAKAAFLRALVTWRCETGINFVLGTTTTDATGLDDVNVVRFDNGSELETTELGRCTTYLNGCTTNGTGSWIVTELDLVFDDATNWNYSSATNSTSLSQYDFESNVLHELGHAHLLGHVVNTNDVMNWAISNSEEQRVLKADNITAANAIQARSTGFQFCGLSLMTNYQCSLGVEDAELDASISVYPNPTNGTFYIKNTSVVNLNKISVYDICGRFISELDIINSLQTNTINLPRVSKGLYFVKILSDSGEITKKILVE